MQPKPKGRLAPFKRAVAEEGIAYTTARDFVLRGEIPIVRLGRAWYVDRADLARFIDRHRETFA